LRVADTRPELSTADWLGAEGVGSWFTKRGETIRDVQGHWIEYRARLISPNGGPTPYLEGVSVDFQ
jgi:hypothetical protein